MIIEVNNLVKRYKDLVALDHFELHVEQGEIYACSGQTAAARLQRSTVCCLC